MWVKTETKYRSIHCDICIYSFKDSASSRNVQQTSAEQSREHTSKEKHAPTRQLDLHRS
ncbi:hypothetical protein PAMP_007637 [Pampus punctatissimus]